MKTALVEVEEESGAVCSECGSGCVGIETQAYFTGKWEKGKPVMKDVTVITCHLCGTKEEVQ